MAPTLQNDNSVPASRDAHTASDMPKKGRGSDSAEPTQSSIRLLDRTFTVLQLFDRQRPEWTATAIARELDLPVSSVFRIVSSLVCHSYLTQDESTKQYRLGSEARKLGDRASIEANLGTKSYETLRRLAHRTGETALLTVVGSDSRRGVCLERVETTMALRLVVTPGASLPLHAGGSLKVLLAYMEAAARERVLDAPLERFSPMTITDPEELRAELAWIRGAGWAFSSEETNIGVWGVAVPILDDRDEIVCGLAAAGPTARRETDRLGEVLAAVYAAGKEIAATLGHRVPLIDPKSVRQRHMELQEGKW